MSDLDEKLRRLLEDAETGIKHCCGQQGCNDIEADIKLIKKAFADEGYITPENAKKTQELVNQMANLAHDMAKLPVTILECVHAGGNWMTGQEWYDRFVKELPPFRTEETHQLAKKAVLQAAKRAAGLQ